jgi:hypothetical protein
MRELTLKELAAYLPYGLKLSKIHVLNIGKGIGSISHMLTTKSNLYKPILRPITEVENDIIHNGGTVNVLDIMNGFWGVEWLGATEKFELHVGGLNIISSPEELPYDLVQVLLEHHFDVFGLIPDNLAIPVTNEFNPYK